MGRGRKNGSWEMRMGVVREGDLKAPPRTPKSSRGPRGRPPGRARASASRPPAPRPRRAPAACAAAPGGRSPTRRRRATPGGIALEQALGALDVDAEVAQVAVVDPDDLGARARARSRAPARRAPRRARRGRASRAGACSETSSCGVSAATISSTASAPASARLVQLVGVDDEVLAQDRQPARCARRAQVVERARRSWGPR